MRNNTYILNWCASQLPDNIRIKYRMGIKQTYSKANNIEGILNKTVNLISV